MGLGFEFYMFPACELEIRLGFVIRISEFWAFGVFSFWGCDSLV